MTVNVVSYLFPFVTQNRIGDHIWWISDVRKFQSHFPGWSYRYGIRDILKEIVEAQMDLK